MDRRHRACMTARMYGGPPPPGPPGGGYHRGPPGSYPPPPPPQHSSPYGSHYSPHGPPPPHYPYGPPGGGYDGYRGPPPPPSSYGRTSPMPRGAAPGDPSTRPSGSPPSGGRNGSPPNHHADLRGRSPTASPDHATSLGQHPMSSMKKLPNHVEVERLRAAAATEITAEEVKPIQTDFHFFAKENMEKYLKLAEEEVRQDLEEGKPLDPILVNTNVNTKLMKAWEALTKDQRDAYMVQEEEDRRRFMEEDEIASRHCATLTARGKSPNNAKGVAAQAAEVAANAAKQLQGMKKEERQEKATLPSKATDRDLPGAGNKSSGHSEEKKVEDGDDPAKRQASETEEDDDDKDIQESPTKRNKVEEPQGEKH
ncbi:MAG: hypothetical protein SGARI_004245 [Bacillariaceae sp.]